MPAGFQPAGRPAPVTVTGFRDPSSTVQQRVIADVQDEIIFWEPESAPLTVLTAGLRKKRKTTQYTFDWLEKEAYPRELTVSGAQTSGGVTITVAAGQGARVIVNHVLINRRTREKLLVTGVAGDTLTVVRGLGLAGVIMNDGDSLEILGTGWEDGSGFGTMKSIQENRLFNMTQIIRTQFGFTGRQIETDLFGGRDPMTERKWMGIEHRKSIEYFMFFGNRFSQTGPGGKIQSFMGGLEYYIGSNVWDLTQTEPTERAFIEFMEYAMKYGRGGNMNGSAIKYLFCSRRWLTIIEGWAREKIRYDTVDKRVGLKVGFFDTTHGTLVLVPQPIFNGEHAGYAVLCDMNHLRYAYHQGRDTKLLDNRQANDVDGLEEEYMTDCSLQVEEEIAHGILKGLPI